MNKHKMSISNSKPKIAKRNQIIKLVALMNLLLVWNVQALATFSYRSSPMQFSKYINNYKNCKVYIANIIIFDCGYDYQAFKWNNLIEHSGRRYNDYRFLVYKQPGSIIKFRREID